MTRVCFVGDVYLPRPVKIAFPLPAPAIINLEAPITRGRQAALGKVNLRADDCFLRETFGDQLLAACLANNHIMDYCDEGLRDTQATLQRLGIPHYGAGDSDDRCGNPLWLEVSGLRLALLGYVCPSTAPVFVSEEGPGVLPIRLPDIRADIQAARTGGAHRVVVSLHWGEQDVHLPKPEDVGTAHAIIEAGADLIVGHHAHCIQPVEWYRGKPICYGLGNCMMPDLDVPAYFGPDQTPGRRFVCRQVGWRRRSLLLCYDMVTGAVEVSSLRFGDGKLTRQDATRPSRYAFPEVARERYRARYRRSYRWGMLWSALASYYTAPKLPRLRHVRELFRILLGRD